MVVWQRLIRFVATDGRILRGEPILPHHNFDLGTTNAGTKLQAKIIVGDDIYDITGKTKVTDEIATVKELLGPLAQEDVPILRCVGLNYAKHSMWNFEPENSQRRLKILTYEKPKSVKEAGRSPPPFPFIFFKPNTCIFDHNADVVIPKICQDDQADYEGELVSIRQPQSLDSLCR
jgi:2-keto-4-pentenoate hydratase/2-oxohepta-3-ene-1,7-dioic acid hydratase in catechol pathway